MIDETALELKLTNLRVASDAGRTLAEQADECVRTMRSITREWSAGERVAANPVDAALGAPMTDERRQAIHDACTSKADALIKAAEALAPALVPPAPTEAPEPKD